MTMLVRFTLGFMLVFTAFFLIALVLIQRGRGGGLAGAFGGAGGQSAFGTKAGDVFTRITVGVAACWILLCILAINVLGTSTSRLSSTLGGAAGQGVPSEIAPESSGEPAADDAADGDSQAKADAATSGGDTESRPAETEAPAADSEPAAAE